MAGEQVSVRSRASWILEFQGRNHCLCWPTAEVWQAYCPRFAKRSQMLSKIHSSHLGIGKCKRRARDVLFWPGMNQQITDMISKCNTCNTYRNAQAREPLKSHELPGRPWQKIAVDLFELDKQDYVVIVDYYSKFFEVSHLPNSKSKTVINHIKPHLARYGIPEIIISDNGPEFSSHEFEELAKHYGFKHITSSPTYSQSNGLVERAVQTAKSTLKKAKAENKDFHLALLDYRNTPREEINLSPAQMLMGRRQELDYQPHHHY